MKPLNLIICIFFLYVLPSCRNSHEVKDIALASTDSTSVTGLTGDSIKLIKTASISVKVKDAHQSARAVSRFAQQMGGMISHQNIASAEDQTRELRISDDSIMVISSYTANAEITARIPQQHLEDFMYGIADMGYFIPSSKMDITDKSLDYLTNQLKQQTRHQLLTDVNHKKRQGLTGMQAVKINDEATEQQITKMQIDADVNYSTVQLYLFQNPLVRKEVMANYAVSDYQLPFGKRISNALSTGWAYFINLIIALMQLWVFIVLSVILWLGYRYYRYAIKL